MQFWCVRGVWVGVGGELLEQDFSHRERVFRTLVVRQERRRCQGQSYEYMLEYIMITVIRSRNEAGSKSKRIGGLLCLHHQGR